MPLNRRHGLFEAFGVELEYMVVDRDTLAIRPIVDAMLFAVSGTYDDIENGAIGWSNELVNHVIELKTNGPAPTLAGLSALFAANVQAVNDHLAPFGAMLMPTGAHPFMDPFKETQLWPHEFNEVYQLYNEIFDCRGHGWANLQSTHINLPFDGDDEFGRLHAAIRLLLPIIPALSASTPLLDGAYTGFLDSRLETYRHNQKRIPAIAGKVVPEAVFTQADYHQRIYLPIQEGIAPFDGQGILQSTFMNSRGAIARFDRSAIEIRIVDIQECPAADLAITAGIAAVTRALVDQRWCGYEAQKRWHEDDLAALFLDVICTGERTIIRDQAYLATMGLSALSADAGSVWQHLFEQVRADVEPELVDVLEAVLARGSLSSRIIRRLGAKPTPAAIRETYRELAMCLAENRLFDA
ncbi:MAG: glutamate-cysteine ligase family protein [Rhodothermales bacterium]|nr:glutamate-cysteine ligase family protein [Rhodothermales bacterium]